MKYMDDVVDYIYQWLDCIARKGIISYTYDLVKILVQIHKGKNKTYLHFGVRSTVNKGIFKIF